eukprot:CAMPEP_0172576330 /NCGR_PEP_ID=MMETSP1067-20121228/137665_1 /TAXON_ID=265564 ORGANISM="Thalassiosira punctigera, Strain Tpunct2005C2" /NCGR_SAMPLE_ID=MMETSP1067 /ASSEMBLY_ACC=CAM_ASM_000444 /LENGTH=476 /DNA_ID=CAMNT_0013368995 /DNA_START=455 /DNA_END=1885 /DNA_ORIENTATION=-
MGGPFDPWQRSIRLAFHSRKHGEYSTGSYQHSLDRHQQRAQPRYFDGVVPLAMIPGDSRHEGDRASFRRATSFLDAAKRGVGQREGGDAEALSAPTTPPATAPTTSDDDSLSVASRVSATAGAIVKNVTTSKKARGRAILLVVAFLYGTLNVTLRAVYATDGPPAASVLSLVRQMLSIASFVPIFMAAGAAKEEEGRDDAESGKYREEESGEGQPLTEERAVRPMWMSALELAFWNFGAQGLINAGLLFSPAARASFLTQTSVVMTPLISALAGESVASSVWGGCGLALLGLYLISTSAATGDAAADAVGGAASALNQGDVMILLGALSWSTYIFRTSRLASSYSELNLQFAKTALLALMYGGWFLTTAASTLARAGTSFLSAGWTEALAPLWSGWKNPAVWLLLAYSAVGPGAVADLLQQRGQRETSASESNVILTMESVFAAACAFVLLGEVSSTREMTGGFLIVAAAILASKE